MSSGRGGAGPSGYGGFPPSTSSAAEDSETERLFRLGDDFLKRFLDLFDKFEAALDAKLLDEALKLAARFNLRSHDACVAALASISQVPEVVSLDKDFLRVDGLEIWNNDIPAKRTRRRAG